MGLMDELKRLARPYEDDDDETFEEDTASQKQTIDRPADAEYASASSFPRTTKPSSAPAATVNAPVREHAAPKVVNINTIHQLKVVVMRPECFNDASEIADHLRDKRAVVLNLEQTEKGVARRVLDFISGAAYVQEGKVKRIAASTYIITPYNVDIIGDNSILTELESSGAYQK
ncbi:MAG: cell division protein SepF [Oscillospiraceae bacterium]|nr:cell division protein SepF [Oscillospiraceae bacterium]